MKTFVFPVAMIAVVSAMCGCNQRDENTIQGQWQVQEMSGWFEFYLGPVKGGPSLFDFSGERFVYTNDRASGNNIVGVFSCDESKSPKQITFEFDNHKIIGIYHLVGTRLTICIGENDLEPPSSFAGGPAERPAIISCIRRR